MDITIKEPNLNEINSSKIIKTIGYKCQNLKGQWSGYFVKSNQKYFRITPDGKIQNIVGCYELNSIYGIRLILKSTNLNEIIQKSKIYQDENNLDIIELGRWPSEETIDYSQIQNLKTTSLSYPLEPKENESIPEFVQNENEYYALINNKFYKTVPLKWYLDKENNLLLQKNAIYSHQQSEENNLPKHWWIYSDTLRENMIFSAIKTVLIKQLTLVKEDEPLESLEKQKEKTLEEIKQKKEFLQRLRYLISENEKLNIQKENLDSEISKIIKNNKTLVKKLEVKGK